MARVVDSSARESETGVYLSVIVPAFNEAKRIGKTIARLHDYLTQAAFSSEILIVIDGAEDQTIAVARECALHIPQVKIIERGLNRGKGFTVRQGMLAAAGEIRLFCDADNSTDIGHFDRMKPLFEKGFDVVIASRNPADVDGAQQVVSQSWYKRLLGHFGNRFIQLVAVPGIRDTQCGFKALRADAAQRIFSQATIEGWGFDIEVLALARAFNYRIGIIPARWINDERSHVRPLDYIRVLIDTLKVRKNFLLGRYRLDESLIVRTGAAAEDVVLPR